MYLPGKSPNGQYKITHTRPKIKILFSGATFHIPLTKSATLNRLYIAVYGDFQGLFFYF